MAFPRIGRHEVTRGSRGCRPRSVKRLDVEQGLRCGTEREEFELFDRFLEDFEALNVSVDPNGIATGLVRAESSA